MSLKIVEYTYDELGQLTTKGVGGKTSQNRLQEIDYAYNVRGWLKNINDVGSSNAAITLGSGDLFGFELNYNAPSSGTALYNGNISQTLWKSTSANPSGNAISNRYDYAYDALNRITSAIDNTGNYSLGKITPITYDKNGNILTLNRHGNRGFMPVDILTYTYSGNQLLKVVDGAYPDPYVKDEGFKDGTNTGNDYTYDANGNMKTDANKGITGISYNHLNLPTTVNIGGGTITYVYDATGVKQKKIVSTGTTTDYAGNYIYENNTLQFFNHPEGYVQHKNGIFSYVYQYKDHLGNVRLSYADVSTTNTPVLEIIEESNYYPFGLKHKGYNNTVSSNGNSAAQKFGFGGKEHQDELGLGWIDITARNYDAALGRWMNIDPLAEQMRRHSPYNYAFNNPIYFIDPDGMAPTDSYGRSQENNAVSWSSSNPEDWEYHSDPKDIIVLFHTVGNESGDEAFKAAAETRKKEIESKKGFDKNKDIVIIVGVEKLSEIKEKMKKISKKYKAKFGNTSEVGIWSHAATDGPIGTSPTNSNPLPSFNRQMTTSGWEDIEFNWITKGQKNCSFYGCNTANPDNSFAKRISKLDNFKDVIISGQSTYSYPSFSPYERRTSIGRSLNSSFAFSYKETYMIGSKTDQGWRAILPTGNHPLAKPFYSFKNGIFLKTGYSPNE